MYMTMVFSLALGLFYSSHRLREAEDLRDWREKIAWFTTQQASRLALLGFAVAVIGASILMSMSRGAITSLAVAGGVVGLAASLRTGGGKRFFDDLF